MKRRYQAAVFAIVLCALTGTSPAAAIDWVVDGVGPQVISVGEDGIRRTDNCQTYHQKIRIESVGVYTSCMYGAQHDSATYRSGGTLHLTIREPFTEKYLVVRGVCEGSASCEYHRSTDVLVETRYTGGFMIAVQVYQRVSERLKWQPSTSTPYGEFRFDAAAPDYVLSDVLGNPVGSGSTAVSRNGKWLVAELRNKGLALVDLESLVARRITPAGYQYGSGMDPVFSLAVSNDGKTVVETGVNAGLSIISVTQSCGTDIVYKMPNSFPLGTERCKTIGATTAGVSEIKYRHHPFFSQDDTVLTVRALTLDNRDVRYVFRPGTANLDAAVKYLAIGDSFTSGEGDEGGAYLPATDVGLEKCHVSSRAYPFVVALQVSLPKEQVRSVACSGARLPDILPDVEYMGQGNRLQRIATTDHPIEVLRQQALDEFIPGRIPQLNFVERYQPEIITVGVGGNDAGIIDKLKVCAMPGTCRWAQPEFLYVTALEIGQMFAPLQQLYQTIRQLTPHSRVYVMGYPGSIQPAGVCDALTSFLFSAPEREFMDRSIRYLNQVMRQAAESSGAVFIDTADAFKSHRLCEQSDTPAIHGFVAGRDTGLFQDIPLLHFISSASFHPTPFGHQRLAQSLHEQSNGLTATCALPECGVWQAVAPLPEPYWRVDSAPQSVVRSADFAIVSPSGQQLDIAIPAGMFAPGTMVALELHSNPTHLGDIAVSQSGGGAKTVKLPDSVLGGFHTVFAIGISPGGLPVVAYQVVEVADEQSTPPTSSLPTQVNRAASGGETQEVSSAVLGAHKSVDMQAVQPSSSDLPGVAKRENAIWLLLLLLPVGIMTVCLLFVLLLKR